MAVCWMSSGRRPSALSKLQTYKNIINNNFKYPTIGLKSMILLRIQVSRIFLKNLFAKTSQIQQMRQTTHNFRGDRPVKKKRIAFRENWSLPWGRGIAEPENAPPIPL